MGWGGESEKRQVTGTYKKLAQYAYIESREYGRDSHAYLLLQEHGNGQSDDVAEVVVCCKHDAGEEEGVL